MKKLIIGTLMFLSFLSVEAKCDWSKVYLAYSNTCNVYKFEIAGTVDTCYKTMTIVTNKKTGAKDTFYTRAFGKTFADTGKYNVFVKVYNKCLKCDTAFEKLVYVTCKPSGTKRCNWSKAGFYYSNKCGTVVFEMGSYIDTCIRYTTWRYNHKTGKLDTIAHDRVFTRTMDTGLYTFKTSFYNKCLGCDTSIYRERVRITCDSSRLGVISEESQSLKIYPNPAYDYIEIEYSGGVESLQIYDETGKMVYSGKTTDRTIYTERWKEGVYLIRVGRSVHRINVRH